MDKEKLKQEINNQMTIVIEGMLNYADVAIPNPNVYRKYRSKILGICNDAIRNLNEFIEEQE